MKYLIVKYQLPSREDFIQRLSDLSLDFGLVYWQHDRIYLPRSAKPAVKSPAPSVLGNGRNPGSPTVNTGHPAGSLSHGQPSSLAPSAQHLPRMVIRTEVHALDQPARYQLILRRYIPDSGALIINRTNVESYTEAAQMLHQLGFVKHAEVSRQRQDLPMGKNAILHLDHIEGLPQDYVKLETTLDPAEKVSEVRADLQKTLTVLGVGPESSLPYFELLHPTPA